MKKFVSMAMFMTMLMMFMFLAHGLAAANTFELKEVAAPAMMEVHKGKMYLLERTTIFIYSLKDKKLLKKFGQEGEGPGEFMINPFGPPMSLVVFDEKLVINSINKISHFTLEGEYIDERPAPPNTVFLPIGKEFLGIGAAMMQKEGMPNLAFRIFDKDIKPKNVLYYTKIKVGNLRNILLPMEALHYIPYYKNKLYVVNSRKGFVIDCFDLSGKKLYSIEKDYEKLPVSDGYKKEAKNWFKTHPHFRRIQEIVLPGLTFEKYQPPIKEMYIDNDTIYTFTHKKKDGRNELILMDLKGKELHRTYLPMPELDVYTYYPYLCTIDDNTYYMLKENEDDEVWELHTETIKK